MPLPYLSDIKRCTAKAKSTQLRCNNPAAFSCKTCRLHGARRSENILRGSAHPKYKNGQETIQAKAQYRAASKRLRDLEQLMVDQNIVDEQFKRTVGRKPSRKLT